MRYTLPIRLRLLLEDSACLLCEWSEAQQPDPLEKTLEVTHVKARGRGPLQAEALSTSCSFCLLGGQLQLC